MSQPLVVCPKCSWVHAPQGRLGETAALPCPRCGDHNVPLKLRGVSDEGGLWVALGIAGGMGGLVLLLGLVLVALLNFTSSDSEPLAVVSQSLATGHPLAPPDRPRGVPPGATSNNLRSPTPPVTRSQPRTPQPVQQPVQQPVDQPVQQPVQQPATSSAARGNEGASVANPTGPAPTGPAPRRRPIPPTTPSTPAVRPVPSATSAGTQSAGTQSLDGLLEQLRSPTASTGSKLKLLGQLVRMEAQEDRRQEVLAVLQVLVHDDHPIVAGRAVDGIAAWGSHEHVPLLISLAEQDAAGRQGSILRALGKIQHPQAAEAMARLAANHPRLARQAAFALRDMGPVAEDAVLLMLPDAEQAVRFQLYGLLGRAGGPKSITALKAMLQSDRHPSDRFWIQNTLRQLEARHQQLQQGPAQ